MNDLRARELAQMFRDNFTTFADEAGEAVTPPARASRAAARYRHMSWP